MDPRGWIFTQAEMSGALGQVGGGIGALSAFPPESAGNPADLAVDLAGHAALAAVRIVARPDVSLRLFAGHRTEPEGASFFGRHDIDGLAMLSHGREGACALGHPVEAAKACNLAASMLITHTAPAAIGFAIELDRDGLHALATVTDVVRQRAATAITNGSDDIGLGVSFDELQAASAAMREVNSAVWTLRRATMMLGADLPSGAKSLKAGLKGLRSVKAVAELPDGSYEIMLPFAEIMGLLGYPGPFALVDAMAAGKGPWQRRRLMVCGGVRGIWVVGDMAGKGKSRVRIHDVSLERLDTILTATVAGHFDSDDRGAKAAGSASGRKPATRKKPPEPAVAEAAKREGLLRYCTKCGKDLAPGKRFCIGCGTRVG